MLEPICERCGYAITGLDTNGDCPECGLSLLESQPERRVGSAWQQRISVANWYRTLATLIRSPRSQFVRIRVDARRCASLTHVNIAIASLLLAITPAAMISLQYGAVAPNFGLTDRFLTDAFAFAISWFTGFWLLWLLTRIEWFGIRLIGRQRAWRVTSTVATAVCAHASFGWIAAGVLSLTGLGVGTLIGSWYMPVLLSVVGFGVGLLAFEWLVYLGVRCCRFANGPPAPGE